MKVYTHLRVVESPDIDWFMEEVIKRSGELQDRGFEIEYDYKPISSKRFMRSDVLVYTCLIKAYEKD